jgi:hypothetical protein
MRRERQSGFGKHPCIATDTALGHGCVFGIEFDQDGVTAQAIGNQAGCAGSAEWVKDYAASGTAGLNARFD